MRWLDSITDSMDVNLSQLQEIVEDSVVWHAAAYGVAKTWTGLSIPDGKLRLCKPRGSAQKEKQKGRRKSWETSSWGGVMRVSLEREHGTTRWWALNGELWAKCGPGENSRLRVASIRKERTEAAANRKAEKKIATAWENGRFLWPQLLCPTVYQRSISVGQPEVSSGSLATQPFLSLEFFLTNNGCFIFYFYNNFIHIP